MKKLFAGIVAGALIPATVFGAYVPGLYTAKMNVNVRSMPSMSGALINHYKQNQAVQVIKVLGSWCQVGGFQKNAYVYCNLLAPAGENVQQVHPDVITIVQPSQAPVAANATVVTNGLMTKQLQDVQTWLVTNSEGLNYINDSYFQGRDSALQWDGEARIADFYFQWPLASDSKCSMVFTGAFHDDEMFKSTCFDAAGMIKTSQAMVTTPQPGYNLPVLPYKTFVSRMLADKSLMSQLDTYFAKAQNVKGLYRLYLNADNVQVWEGKFIDMNSGYFMTVSVDASKADGAFLVQKGRF